MSETKLRGVVRDHSDQDLIGINETDDPLTKESIVLAACICAVRGIEHNKGENDE